MRAANGEHAFLVKYYQSTDYATRYLRMISIE